MAYQVLARKWRPQSFAQLVGQEHVATTLLNALRNQRMPHALLFTGARGVGKTSVARILAKSLRCSNAKDFVPCHTCGECQEIAGGRAIDVIEIDGASNNGVENVRELRETVGYMPSRGQYKVYIIDEVHMLSTSAFNALLKTLEEPPAHVVFIFATTEVQKIPVTILSRCQRFDFRRIAIRKIVEFLKTILESEKVEAEPQALWLIAREAEGSMRDSLSLLDQVITFCGNKVTHTQVVEVLGLTDRTILTATLSAVLTRNAQDCLDIIEKVFHHGYDPKQFVQDLLEHLRNLMIVKISGDSKLDFLDLPDQEIEELKNFASQLSTDDVHLLFDMTLKGASDVLRGQDSRVVLEMLLLRLSQAPRLVSIEALISGQLPSVASPVVSSIETPNLEKKTPNLTPSTNDLKPSPKPSNNWTDFVDLVKKEKPLLGAKLEYAALQSVEAEKVLISFRKEQEFFYNQVSQREVVQQLMDLFGKHWGKPYAVEVKLNTDAEAKLSPREQIEKDQKEKDKAFREKVESHPLVKEVQSVLKGKLTSIKETR